MGLLTTVFFLTVFLLLGTPWLLFSPADDPHQDPARALWCFDSALSLNSLMPATIAATGQERYRH